jgi:hypothetical protein
MRIWMGLSILQDLREQLQQSLVRQEGQLIESATVTVADIPRHFYEVSRMSYEKKEQMRPKFIRKLSIPLRLESRLF